jgi:hypothetical protein
MAFMPHRLATGRRVRHRGIIFFYFQHPEWLINNKTSRAIAMINQAFSRLNYNAKNIVIDTIQESMMAAGLHSAT